MKLLAPEFSEVCVGIIYAPFVIISLILALALYFPTLGWSLNIWNRTVAKVGL